MERRGKIVAVSLIIAALGGFGYYQYYSATQITATITSSTLIEGTDADYMMEITFENPTLMYLNAGETEFTVSVDGKGVGYGTMDPFMLPALSKAEVYGTYYAAGGGAEGTVKISGVTQYEIPFTTIDVPFVFYPSDEQSTEFIRHG